MAKKEDANIMKVKLTFSNPYYTMQALHILTVNEIDVVSKDGSLLVNRKDESKIKNLLKKMGLRLPKFEYEKIPENELE